MGFMRSWSHQLCDVKNLKRGTDIEPLSSIGICSRFQSSTKTEMRRNQRVHSGTESSTGYFLWSGGALGVVVSRPLAAIRHFRHFRTLFSWKWGALVLLLSWALSLYMYAGPSSFIVWNKLIFCMLFGVQPRPCSLTNSDARRAFGSSDV